MNARYMKYRTFMYLTSLVTGPLPADQGME